MFKCDWKYTIYVPKEVGDSIVEDTTTCMMNFVLGMLRTYFGGYTYWEADGGWEGPDGSYKEPTYVIEVVTHQQDPSAQFEHITNFILGHSKEKEILVAKTPIDIITYLRKDYHD